jgi:hypothetical protein
LCVRNAEASSRRLIVVRILPDADGAFDGHEHLGRIAVWHAPVREVRQVLGPGLTIGLILVFATSAQLRQLEGGS